MRTFENWLYLMIKIISLVMIVAWTHASQAQTNIVTPSIENVILDKDNATLSYNIIGGEAPFKLKHLGGISDNQVEISGRHVMVSEIKNTQKSIYIIVEDKLLKSSYKKIEVK